MSDNRWSANRRTFLTTAGAAGVAGLAGCSGGGGSAGDEGSSGEGDTSSDGETTGSTESTPTAQFILNPAEADVEIERQYQPMFEYLESEVDVAIEPDRAASYTATLQAMRNDQGEIADISPSAVVAGEGVVDIVGVRIAYGAAQYFSTITTTPDSGIESLSDLEGELIYMGDILSVWGRSCRSPCYRTPGSTSEVHPTATPPTSTRSTPITPRPANRWSSATT